MLSKGQLERSTSTISLRYTIQRRFLSTRFHLEILSQSYFRKVALVLMQEGFDGMIANPATAPMGQGGSPWPEYRRTSRREILYPVRLRANHPVAFDLHLPGPTTIPLVKLLGAYGKIIKGVPEMITLLFLWMKVFVTRMITTQC